MVPGDLVDDGCNLAGPNDPGCAEQWGNYTSYFKVNPTAEDTNSCRYPAFEGAGNHDGGNSTDPHHGLVRQGIVTRNKARTALQAQIGTENYTVSQNGLHYSWNWGGVHFVMLGVYPGTDGDCASPGAGSPGNGCCSATGQGICWGWHSPENSLDFLIEDLARLDTATPTVLFMHYGMQGFGSPGTVPWAGYSPDFWWSTREALAFGEAIASHNVVAIVHGHTHACVFYQWDLSNHTGRVYDVYNAPSLQKGGPQSTPSQYLTFEVDVEQQRFRVFQRVGGMWGAIMHEKTLNVSSPMQQKQHGSTSLDRKYAGKTLVWAEDSVNVVAPHHIV